MNATVKTHAKINCNTGFDNPIISGTLCIILENGICKQYIINENGAIISSESIIPSGMNLSIVKSIPNTHIGVIPLHKTTSSTMTNRYRLIQNIIGSTYFTFNI